MSSGQTPESAQEDLAYLRGLVEGGGNLQATVVTGQVFLIGGLLYGLQATVQGLDALNVIDLVGPWALAVAAGPTVLFLVLLFVLIWGRGKMQAGGTSARATGAIFQVVGLANLVLAVIFAVVSIRRRDAVIWMLEPITIFVMMGAAFVMAGQLRKRKWLMLVGFGWWVSAITAAVSIGTGWYIVAIGAALFAFLAAPGAYMMRRPTQV
jgi:hypothetical protein